MAYLDETAFEIEFVLFFVLFMFLFDAPYWPISAQVVCWSVIFAAVCIALCLLVAIVPYGPICIFSVLVPLSIFGIKNTCFPHVPANILVGWNYKVYVSLASIILLSFFYWCALKDNIDGNMWDSETNAEYSGWL